MERSPHSMGETMGAVGACLARLAMVGAGLFAVVGVGQVAWSLIERPDYVATVAPYSEAQVESERHFIAGVVKVSGGGLGMLVALTMETIALNTFDRRRASN